MGCIDSHSVSFSAGQHHSFTSEKCVIGEICHPGILVVSLDVYKYKDASFRDMNGHCKRKHNKLANRESAVIATLPSSIIGTPALNSLKLRQDIR